jgi:hypothetical protein
VATAIALKTVTLQQEPDTGMWQAYLNTATGPVAHRRYPLRSVAVDDLFASRFRIESQTTGRSEWVLWKCPKCGHQGPMDDDSREYTAGRVFVLSCNRCNLKCDYPTAVAA